MPREPLKPGARIERERFLRNFFGGTITGSIGTLVEMMSDLRFDAGATVFRAGEAAEHVYFLVSGALEMRADDAPPWIFDDASMIGVLDVMVDRPRARTAVVTAPSRMLVLRSDDYFGVVEDNFDVARMGILRVATGNHALSVELAPAGGFASVGDDAPPPSQAAPPPEPLSLVEKLIALRRRPPLAKAGIRAVADLAAQSDEVRLAAGDTLWRPGEGVGNMYLVASGIVGVERSDPAQSASFGAGELVGGLCSIGDDRRNCSATAATAAAVLRFRTDDLFDIMEDNFELVRAVLACNALDRERLVSLKRAREAQGAK